VERFIHRAPNRTRMRICAGSAKRQSRIAAMGGRDALTAVEGRWGKNSRAKRSVSQMEAGGRTLFPDHEAMSRDHHQQELRGRRRHQSGGQPSETIRRACSREWPCSIAKVLGRYVGPGASAGARTTASSATRRLILGKSHLTDFPSSSESWKKRSTSRPERRQF